jgi:formylglycine-generating enzyme required for sulfatase activity
MAVPSPSHTGNNAAAYFLPTENEWYKAAYYSGGGTNSAYYTYPTKSYTTPGNSLALALSASNEANYYLTDPTNYLTPVGSFVLSPGPYGTYDMGGDVFQWNEANISDSFRQLRGGSWDDASATLASSWSNTDLPTLESNDGGFRIASSVAVPEPGSIALLLACAVAFGIWRRRRNA